jgi:hypothetical protein
MHTAPKILAALVFLSSPAPAFAEAGAFANGFPAINPSASRLAP